MGMERKNAKDNRKYKAVNPDQWNKRREETEDVPMLWSPADAGTQQHQKGNDLKQAEVEWTLFGSKVRGRK